MLSRVFLIKQGQCCGHKCLMCPYEKMHSGKSKKVRNEVIDQLQDWEKHEIGKQGKFNFQKNKTQTLRSKA